MSRFSFCVLATLVFVPLLLSTPARAQEEVVDEISAVVGDQIILRSEVDAIVVGIVRQQNMPYTPDLWRSALEQMIDEKVLVIHAERDTTIEVTDESVDQQLEARLQQLSAQFGGIAKLEEAYGKSSVEIKAEFREDFRNQLLADEIRRRKMRTIKVTPSEIQDWFRQFPTDSLPTLPEKVRAAHIVRFPVITDAARAEAQEVLAAIRDSVVTGTSTIEDMATTFTEDPGSMQTEGRYPSMSLKELVPEFAAIASRLAIGEISPVFETPFGLHILRVNSRRGDLLDYNHILIRFDERKADPAPAIQFLTSLRDSVLAEKATFESLARKHSSDDESKLRGGRVVDPQSGSRDLFLEALGPEWLTALQGLEIGGVSEPKPVALQNGRTAYHIVLLQERFPAHRVSIEADYPLVEQYAQREKENRVLSEWLTTLRKDVYVDIRTAAR